MTAQRVPQLHYNPREFGALLVPPRSGQYVRQRIHDGEIVAELVKGEYRIPHVELRRLTGQDLTVPGHEGATRRDERVRELNVRLARLGAELAQCVALVAEIDAGV